MARLGLGDDWRCAFANDFDPVKAATYRANFADAADHLHQGDVWKLSAADLPGLAGLAWASSHCQDFSLAGPGGTGRRAILGLLRLLAADGGPGRGA
jgi:DNA (cytosine-5)-methyltransferase 1